MFDRREPVGDEVLGLPGGPDLVARRVGIDRFWIVLFELL